MSAASRFASAIGRVGAEAVLLKGEAEAGSFPASLQPAGQPEEPAALTTGLGGARRYTLYVPTGGTAGAVAAGDTVVVLGQRYYVQNVEPVCFRGEKIYYRARVQACRGEG